MFKGLKKLFDPSYKELTRCEKIADKVIALADKYKAMSEEELKNQTNFSVGIPHRSTHNRVSINYPHTFSVCG